MAKKTVKTTAKKTDAPKGKPFTATIRNVKTGKIETVKGTEFTNVAVNLETLEIKKAAALNPSVEAVSAGVARLATKVSVRDAVLSVFKSAPTKEFRTDEVVLAAGKLLPKGVKPDTILWTITLLKKSGEVIKVRNEGHAHILRLGNGVAPVASKAVVSTSPKAIKAPAVGTGALGDALVKLSALVAQREKIDIAITQAKGEIGRMVSAI